MAILNSKRKKWMHDHGWFWVGGMGLVIGAFDTLDVIINNATNHKPGLLGSWTDYSHEIASAILGSIFTLAFTALLLRAQTESAAKLQNEQIKAQSEIDRKLQESQAKAERERENGVKFFEEKLKFYGALLKGLEKFIQKEKLQDKDFTKLSLTCLHVSYIADWLVLDKLENFTASLLSVIREDSEEIDKSEEREEGRDPITHAEKKTILSRFSKVTTVIKSDLDKNKTSNRSEIVVDQKVKEANRLDKVQGIIDNLSLCSIAYAEAEKRLKSREAVSTSSSLMNEATFLDACSLPEEKKFYTTLFVNLNPDRLNDEPDGIKRYQILWTYRGFSIEHTLKFFPSGAEPTVKRNVVNRPAQESRKHAVQEALRAALQVSCTREFGNQNIKFSWEEMNPSVDVWMVLVKKVLDPLEAGDKKAPPHI